ncbi:MAG: flagellar biosynthesis anti-sigma factor FlgM [Gemmatimonadota bacterium]
MKIYGNSSEVLRSDQARELQKSGNNRKESAPQPASPVDRGDKVQISDAGRALAAKAASGPRGELSAERVEQVRERIISGAYNSLEVVDQVARKLMASGDL